MNSWRPVCAILVGVTLWRQEFLRHLRRAALLLASYTVGAVLPLLAYFALPAGGLAVIHRGGETARAIGEAEDGQQRLHRHMFHGDMLPYSNRCKTSFFSIKLMSVSGVVWIFTAICLFLEGLLQWPPPGGN